VFHRAPRDAPFKFGVELQDLFLAGFKRFRSIVSFLEEIAHLVLAAAVQGRLHRGASARTLSGRSNSVILPTGEKAWMIRSASFKSRPRRTSPHVRPGCLVFR
jgi:hypothetical protein